MALTIRHAKSVNIADDPKAAAAGEVLPSDWNATHVDSGGNVINIRQVLTADTTYNVSTTGSDAGDGSAGNPWLTIQHAVGVISSTVDLNGFNVTIQLADGTYDGATLSDFYNYVPNPTNAINFLPVPILKIQGNASDHTKTIVRHSLSATEFTFFVESDSTSVLICFKNLTISNPSAAGALFVTGAAIALVGDGDGIGTVEINNNIGAGPPTEGGGDCFAAQFGSVISLNDNIIYTGTSAFAMRADTNSIVTDFFSAVQTTITLTAGAVFQSFARAQVGGIIWLTGVSFSGTATGGKFFCRNGGIIDVALIGGSDLNTLPGSTAGIITGAGEYIYSSGTLSLHSTGGVIVANLPSASQQGVGATNFVTDSNATLAAGLGNVVAGLGGNSVPVYSDGTNWRIG